MRELWEVVSWFILFLFFMLADLVFYYDYGQEHSLVPFVLTAIMTLIVFLVLCMAIYEIIKHRNDKEQW